VGALKVTYMKLIERKYFLLLLSVLALTACDSERKNADQRIEAAVAENTCEIAKPNVLLLLNVAGGADNIESVTRLAEDGKLNNIHASKLEGEVARQLYKYQSSWAIPTKTMRLDSVGTVTDYAERGELAWKIGKEICIKLMQK
jgi:hypothetical protein